MPVDMLERLRLDPGSRTLGELLQERQWAVIEIERLRQSASRPITKDPSSVALAKTAGTVKDPSPHDWVHGMSIAPTTQLLRLSDVSGLIGLSRSTIYMKVARGDFPAAIRVGARARRWRLADIAAWQIGLGH